MPRKARPLAEVIEDILDGRVFTDHETGCWLWRPGQWNSGNGYGKIRFEGKAWMVHRLVWTFFKGAIPVGVVLDHVVCKRRPCCNPDHLEPVTVGINTYRGAAVLFGRTVDV